MVAQKQKPAKHEDPGQSSNHDTARERVSSMASFFSGVVGPSIDVDVKLADEEQRKHVELKSDAVAASGKENAGGGLLRKDSIPIYYDGESVKGTAVLRIGSGKAVKHDGIKVEFVGSIGTL